jgi:hypothetical protein
VSVRSGQAITVEFTTSRFDTGAATNADSTPAGTLVVNGTDNAATVTVTNVDTGRYKAAVTLPTLAVGDVAELSIAATVNAVAAKEIVWRDSKDVDLDSSGRALLQPTQTGVTIPTVTTLTNLPAVTTDWLTAAGVKADAVTKIQAGLSTYAGGAVASVTGAVASVTGDVAGKVLGGGAGTITGTGARVVDASGNAVAPAATALSTAQWTNTRAGLQDNLDAAVSSRMATYTQPTGFLAATFPTGTVASTTNITAGTVTTVTTLTNLPAAPTDWLTAVAVSAAAVTKIQAGLSTYAGGDTAGTTTLLARLTSTRAGNLDFLDVAVSSRLATAGYTAPPSAAAVADQVWEETLTDHSGTSGSTAAALNAAGSAGDPWATALPGAYGAGTAGNILGVRLDAAVSSRSTYAGGDTTGTTTLLARLTAGRGANLDFLDATISSRSVYAGADTAGTTILLARLTSTRAANLDFLDVSVASRLATSGYTAPPSAAAVSAQVAADLATAHGAGSWVDAGGAVTVAAGGLDAVLVAGIPLPEALRHIGAAVAGPLSGSQTATEVFLDFANVISHTVTADAAGNRTAIVYA